MTSGSESFELVWHARDQLNLGKAYFDMLSESYLNETFTCQALQIIQVRKKDFVDCQFVNLTRLDLSQAEPCSFVRCKFPQLTQINLSEGHLKLDKIFSSCYFGDLSLAQLSKGQPIYLTSGQESAVKYLETPLILERYDLPDQSNPQSGHIDPSGYKDQPTQPIQLEEDYSDEEPPGSLEFDLDTSRLIERSLILPSVNLDPSPAKDDIMVIPSQDQPKSDQDQLNSDQDQPKSEQDQLKSDQDQPNSDQSSEDSVDQSNRSSQSNRSNRSSQSSWSSWSSQSYDPRVRLRFKQYPEKEVQTSVFTLAGGVVVRGLYTLFKK